MWDAELVESAPWGTARLSGGLSLERYPEFTMDPTIQAPVTLGAETGALPTRRLSWDTSLFSD